MSGGECVCVCGRGGGSGCVYLCCSFALGIQKIHFRKTILTWQDNDKQSDRPTDQSAIPRSRAAKRCTGLLIGSLPHRRPLLCVCLCVCAVRILIFITATAKVLEKLRSRRRRSRRRRRQRIKSAQAAQKWVFLRNCKLFLSRAPAPASGVASSQLLRATGNWRSSSSSSSRRCRQNELASRSQSESLRVCVCVRVCVCAKCARMCVGLCWVPAQASKTNAQKCSCANDAPAPLSLSCHSPALRLALFVSHCRCQLQLRFRLWTSGHQVLPLSLSLLPLP